MAEKSEKSGKSIKDMMGNLGYKKVADYIALIAGLFLFIVLLVDLGAGLMNYNALTWPFGWNYFWGVWLVNLMLVGMIALFPIVARISIKINAKIKIMPEIDEEASKRMVLFIAWLIIDVLLLINCVFWQDKAILLSMQAQLHQTVLYGIEFILLTLVVLQDIIPGMNKEL
ncbi:MAG: hypothetical protein KGD57_08500 [Candidatus Lokiarchaeota archaeon]|nr:hypothetical protein [Candidatus Lokiarchaeota archaeon]